MSDVGVTTIFAEVAVATKLNQTSASTMPPGEQEEAGAEPVAPATSPTTGLQDALAVKGIAPAHSSLAGVLPPFPILYAQI